MANTQGGESKTAVLKGSPRAVVLWWYKSACYSVDLAIMLKTGFSMLLYFH